jgi:CRP-like cAMP-binding protein
VTNQGNIELRFARVSKKYLKSWFLLDLLVVGVDWFELIMKAAADGLGFARLGKASRIFRILRMVRLLRMAKMTEVLNLLAERLDSEKLVILIDVVKLFTMMLGSGHFIACLWYAIGNADTSSRNWLVEFDFKEEALSYRYLMSLRWAISQFAGGMDEVTPQSLMEHVYAACIYLTAFWTGAVLVSVLTSSMTQWYIIGSHNAQQLTLLRRYLSQNGISKKLALRVQRNAKHALAEQQKHMPEGAVVLIKNVSEPLRVELHFEMYHPTLSIHPFFARYAEECPHVVKKVCHTTVASMQVSKSDTIFNVGEMPSFPRMFIVDEGRLTYITSGAGGRKTVSNSGGDASYHSVEKHNWVSEAPLWVTWAHRGTLKAVEDSYICALDAKEFQKIVGQFEHSGFDPRLYAAMFVQCLNEIPGITDLANEEMTKKFESALFREEESHAAHFLSAAHTFMHKDVGHAGTDAVQSVAAKFMKVKVAAAFQTAARPDKVDDAQTDGAALGVVPDKVTVNSVAAKFKKLKTVPVDAPPPDKVDENNSSGLPLSTEATHNPPSSS